ncbi:MAG: hypothetical protein ACRDSM_07020, partial [Pseudonocardiaceae bacterium]
MGVDLERDGRVGVADPITKDLGLDAGVETGNRQCSNRANACRGAGIERGYSSWLVIAGLGELGGVAVPVA